MAVEKLTAQSAAFGSALAEMPVRSMLESMAAAIMDAQAALDDNSVRSCRQMAGSTVTLLDSEGHPVARSLLDLGLLPSFYHFRSADLEISVSLSMRTEEASALKVGVAAGASFGQTDSSSTTDAAAAEAPAGTTTTNTTTGDSTTTTTSTPAEPAAAPAEPVPGTSQSQSVNASFGMSLNYESSRKFAFDASGAAKVRAKLVSVPAPAVLVDAILDNARGRQAA